MKTILGVFLLLWCCGVKGADYAWVSVLESGVLSQGWIYSSASFYPNTEATRNFATGFEAGTNVDTTIDLGQTLSPGTYKLWIAMATITSTTNMMIGFPSVGDGSVANNEFRGNVITNLGIFTSTIAFSNLTLRITKLTPIGTTHTYYFSAIGVMPTNYNQLEIFGAGYSETSFADYTLPTTTNTDFASGNFIPNGDFELGMNGGWTFGRLAKPAYANWINQAIATNGASHGSNYVVLDGYKAVGTLLSPPIRVSQRGKISNLTLSFDARQSNSTPLTVRWGNVFTNFTLFPNAPASWTFTPATTWTRYSTNFVWTNAPEGTLFVDFVGDNSTATSVSHVDQLLLCEGTSTNYTDNAPLEMGMNMGGINGNMLNTNTPRAITVVFSNNRSTNVTCAFRYEAFDFRNNRVAAGTSNFTAVVGITRTNLTLNTTNNGITRVMAWVDGEESVFRDELTFSVTPFPASSVIVTNSLFAIHGNFQNEVSLSNRVWGFPAMNRSTSPGEFARWSTIESVSNTFNFTTAAGLPGMTPQLEATYTNQIVLLTVNEPTRMPSHSVTSGYPRLDRLSNYVWKVVTNGLNYTHYYETDNEPFATLPDPTTYANMLEAQVGAIKTADPLAFIVAFALDNYGDSAQMLTWVSNVWSVLTPTAHSNINAITLHLYPQDIDINISDSSQSARADRAMSSIALLTGKEIWQGEGGFYNQGIRKGDAVGTKIFTPNAYPSRPEEKIRRAMIADEVEVRQLVRSFGVGFKKWIYYDVRQQDANLRSGDTHPSLWNIGYDALTAMGSAFLWSKRFIDTPTNGIRAMTNGQALGYLFARSDERVLSPYSLGRTNLDFTVTNGFFARYDMHGNRLGTNETTFRVGKDPTYWVSGTLSTQQMIDIFNTASIAAGTDTTPPTVSIDFTAVGRVNNRKLPLLFSWTAMDESTINTADFNTNVVTSFRFSGLTDWSVPSALRTVTLTNIPNETYLEVKAWDKFGNMSAAFAGPLFGNEFPPASATNRLNVIGTANIGAITIVAP